MNGTGSGPCLMAGLGVSGAEMSGYTVSVFVFTTFYTHL